MARTRAAAKPPQPHRRRSTFAVLCAVAVCLVAYAGLNPTPSGTTAPDLGELGRIDTRPTLASLSYSGPQTTLTGSVDHLFSGASFTGPNRLEKTDRFKPVINVLEVASLFADTRLRLAALRGPESDIAQDISVASAYAPIPAAMPVSTFDPSAGMAALDASDAIAPGGESDAPMPTIASQQLAYARASAPISTGYLTTQAVNVSEKQLNCLAQAIYFEARGENYRGQVGVAQVVLNRVDDHRYPDTICAVVFQNQHRRNACQFSFACDGIADRVTERRAWDQAEEIATKVLAGELYLPDVGKATHYHATYVRPAWAPRMTKLTQIGLHIFYEFKSGWLFG